MDGFNLQRLQHSPALREVLAGCGVFLIDAEDAVFVRVEADRPGVLLEIPLQAGHVGLGRFRRDNAQREQPAGGIVNEHKQRTLGDAAFNPVMR